MSASSLAFVQLQIIRYGPTTLLALGDLGNFAIVLIFSKNRRNACTMYLIAGAVMNIMSLSFNIAQYLYNGAYGDPTGTLLVYCKLRSYLANVWGQMSRFFFVFACIDRYALISANARIRAASRPSVALWPLGIGTVIWHIIPIHMLILLSIINGRCGAHDSYYIVYSIYNLVAIWLIPCTMMITFGYMAYSNIKQLHARIRLLRNDRSDNRANVIIQRHHRDLLIMVVTEVIAYIILIILYPCIVTEVSITNYLDIVKSRQRQQIENFVLFYSQYLLSVTNAMSFYIYFVVSKAFRNDCKKFISKGWCRIKRQTDLVTVIPRQTNVQ